MPLPCNVEIERRRRMTAFDSTTATNAELDLKQQEVDASRNTKLVVECAADIPPERVEFLWPSRLAIGKHSLIAGEAGLGKSQITISMAAVVTTGCSWPCGKAASPLGVALEIAASSAVGSTA
jgi:AAA domain